MEQKRKKRKIILYIGMAYAALMVIMLLVSDGRAIFSPRYAPDPDYVAGSDWERQEVAKKDTSKMSSDPVVNLFLQLYDFSGDIINRSSADPFEVINEGKTTTEE